MSSSGSATGPWGLHELLIMISRAEMMSMDHERITIRGPSPQALPHRPYQARSWQSSDAPEVRGLEQKDTRGILRAQSGFGEE